MLTHSVADMWKVYRLMVFNYLIDNRDDIFAVATQAGLNRRTAEEIFTEMKGVIETSDLPK